LGSDKRIWLNGVVIDTQMQRVFSEETTDIVTLLCIGSLSLCHAILNFSHCDDRQTDW
jgi:hypothetical protein